VIAPDPATAAVIPEDSILEEVLATEGERASFGSPSGPGGMAELTTD
jgi:hypothetical protein